MSKAQRDKGRRGELEVAALLNEYGLDAELVYGQEERTGALGDVASTAGNWEVKRRSTLPAWLHPADAVRGVFVRRDRGPWLLLVRATDFLDMLADRRDLLARACQLCAQRKAPGCCWLCAAASRIAAGETEAGVLADYGYARPTSGDGVGGREP